MGIWFGLLCKLLLVGFGMDSFLPTNQDMDFLLVYPLVRLSNDGVGHQEASSIQAVIWGEVPKREKGDIPFYYLSWFIWG